jgi:hypothetical protein
VNQETIKENELMAREAEMMKEVNIYRCFSSDPIVMI